MRRPTKKVKARRPTKKPDVRPTWAAAYFDDLAGLIGNGTANLTAGIKENLEAIRDLKWAQVRNDNLWRSLTSMNDKVREHEAEIMRLTKALLFAEARADRAAQEAHEARTAKVIEPAPYVLGVDMAAEGGDRTERVEVPAPPTPPAAPDDDELRRLRDALTDTLALYQGRTSDDGPKWGAYMEASRALAAALLARTGGAS